MAEANFSDASFGFGKSYDSLWKGLGSAGSVQANCSLRFPSRARFLHCLPVATSLVVWCLGFEGECMYRSVLGYL